MAPGLSPWSYWKFADPLTYVVLVILIALWAAVLVPPYLKDRRGGTFGSSTSLPTSGTGGRFMPLQQVSAAPVVRRPSPTSVPPRSGIVDLRTSGAGGAPVAQLAGTGPASAPGNVVSLHVVGNDLDVVAPETDDFEAELRRAWEQPRSNVMGVPSTTTAARERRRQILLVLTAGAFLTLVLNFLGMPGMVPIHIMFDLAFLGFAMLLVRRRQIDADRAAKIEPIRPPVSEQRPVAIQPAPAYLLRSGT